MPSERRRGTTAALGEADADNIPTEIGTTSSIRNGSYLRQDTLHAK